MKRFMLDSLQALLNRYLLLDPESLVRLNPLQHKFITFKLLGAGITFQLSFENEKISITFDNFFEPDTTISGTPISLFRLAMAKEQDRQAFFKEDVMIEGDLTTAENLMNLFKQLEVDWEEYLSRYISDVPAYHIGRLVKKVNQKTHQTYETLLQNVNEYVHEEAKFAPTSEALQDFFSEIDELRMDIDRIETRIKRVKEKTR